jgi:hypothetical protein
LEVLDVLDSIGFERRIANEKSAEFQSTFSDLSLLILVVHIGEIFIVYLF